MTVSVLLEQPCDTSDSPIKLVARKVVNSLFQNMVEKLGTISASTTCQQLVNRVDATYLQLCFYMCVFTRLCLQKCNLDVLTLIQITHKNVIRYLSGE